MQDFGLGQVASREAAHPFPFPAAAATLAATPKRLQPEAEDVLVKAVDAMRVARHSVIVQPALDHASQPPSRFTHRAMPPFA